MLQGHRQLFCLVKSLANASFRHEDEEQTTVESFYTASQKNPTTDSSSDIRSGDQFYNHKILQ